MRKHVPGQVVYQTRLDDEAWKARMTLLCDILTDVANKHDRKMLYEGTKTARKNRLKKRTHNGITHHG